MTRLFLLASLFAVAFAHSDYGSKSYNADKSSNDNKGTSNSASSSSTSTTEVISITIVAVNEGGSSSTTQMSAPAVSPGTVHQVTVGGPSGLVYSPDTISAAVGDMVQFNFLAVNHTVTQSSFAQPCVKMSGGVDSGFMANPNSTLSPPPMMMFQVMTASPIWMYCKQKGHCGKGMVFSINPTADKSQQAFQAAAIAQNGTATSSTAAAGSSTTATAAAAAAATSSSSSAGTVVAGTGSTNGGTCSCSCLCGAGSFPLAAQGLGAMGGMGGSIPAAAAGVMGKRSVRLLSV